MKPDCLITWRNFSKCVRSPAAAVACSCGAWNCCWAAVDGPSQAATAAAVAAGVPTPASGPERSRLVLVSMSGGESIICPLSWVSNLVGPARPLGYLRVTPLEENVQALVFRVRPPKEAFPLEKGNRERTRAQPALSPWTRVLLRPQHSIVQVWGTPKLSSSNGGDVVWFDVARPMGLGPGVMRSHAEVVKLRFTSSLLTRRTTTTALLSNQCANFSKINNDGKKMRDRLLSLPN